MRRILIIRPSAIGDVVMASSMLPALRRAYPDGYIAWLVDSPLEDLLKHNPLLDEIISWPKSYWRTLLRRGCLGSLVKEGYRFIKKLKGYHFDLAIDAQGLFRSRLFAWFSGAGQRIGLESREPGSLLMTRIVSRNHDIHLIASEYRSLLKSLGLSVDGLQMQLVLGEADKSSVRKIRKELGINSRYAVLCPFTTRDQKKWLPERWARLAEVTRSCFELDIVLLGGRRDRQEGHAIISESKIKIHSLVGNMSVAESGAIVCDASLVIGVDTGLTHMGIAFNRPTVALFGATCPYLVTGRDNAVVIYHPRPCSPCRRRPTCNGDYECMRTITVEEVAEAVGTVLGGYQG